jgi:hypothetical protein
MNVISRAGYGWAGLASAKNYGANNYGAKRASQHGKGDEDVFEETHARHIHPPRRACLLVRPAASGANRAIVPFRPRVDKASIDKTHESSRRAG